jgi:hypothetical protein
VEPVVYADFADPAAYLASRYADRLARAGTPLHWRAVEVDPTVAVTGRRLDPAEQEELRAQLEQLALACDGASRPVPNVPAFEPNTQGAVSAYAEASLAGIADDVRRLLVELYWHRGADIGSHAVLRTALAEPFLRSRSRSVPLHEFGYAITADRAPITSAAHREIRAWRTQWQRLGAPRELLVVCGTSSYRGADALRLLAKELAGADDDANPEPAEPDPSPDVTDPKWISQTGGRWLRGYHLSHGRAA